MESSNEPILDIIRGLSTITSVSIMVSQVKNFYTTVFRSPCYTCRGAGTVICRHCHGTKIRRTHQSPMTELVPREVVEHPDLRYECYHCGQYGLNDFDYDKEEEDDEAWNLMDNLKAAMANRPRPHKHRHLAGTVPCPTCYGQCQLSRHTPDVVSLLNLDGTWQQQIARREAERADSLDDADFSEEYIIGKIPDLRPIEKRMPNLRGMEGKTFDDVVLPYVDDSDTTESEDDD